MTVLYKNLAFIPHLMSSFVIDISLYIDISKLNSELKHGFMHYGIPPSFCGKKHWQLVLYRKIFGVFYSVYIVKSLRRIEKGILLFGPI